MSIRVTVWSEFIHEKRDPKILEIYPHGMHEAIAASLRKGKGLEVRTATQDQPEHGLTEEVLKNTDVLTWWGHMGHSDIKDLVVERVYHRVLEGMGLLVLHSAHYAKIFQKLMGTTCSLKWRDDGPKEREILWVTRPGHPIVQGIDDHFILPREEMYGEYFDVPDPECVFLTSGFTGGEVFRSGCTWTRGCGKVVYFRPGHETFPTYHDANVLKVIENAVRWLAPLPGVGALTNSNRKAGWLDKK